jgi:hypothetical protein
MTPLLLSACTVRLCRPIAPTGPYAVYLLRTLPFKAHGAFVSARTNSESNQNKTRVVPLPLAVRAAMEKALGVLPKAAWLMIAPLANGPQLVDGVLISGPNLVGGVL